MANIFRIDRSDNTITLGTTDTTINIASHTALLLLALNASKDLESVSDLTAWIAGTANQITVTDDTDGTLTLSFPNSITIPGKLTAGSFASPLDVTNTRQYGLELHYSGDDYNVTGIRSRARLKTTDTTATAQGALLQAANEDGIDAGVLNGALIEAIGKSDSTASTISMMRGCLVNTEWNAKDTVTDLRVLHVRTHTRDAATEGYVSDTGYGIYIENEAVGGNGQALDAGIYFKDTNISGGNSAFTYGIDFSGGTFATTEIKLKNGGTIGSSGASVNIDSSGNVSIGPITPTYSLDIRKDHDDYTFLRISNQDGGSSSDAGIVLDHADLTGYIEVFPSDWSTVLYRGRIGFTLGSATGNGVFVSAPAASQTIDFINFDGALFVSMRITNTGNIGFGQTSFGDNATKTFAQSTGVAPTTSPADCYQMYSADIVGGHAACHIRNENDTIIKLYQQAHIADAPGDTTANNATTINAILVALENNGLLAA